MYVYMYIIVFEMYTVNFYTLNYVFFNNCDKCVDVDWIALAAVFRFGFHY